MNDLMGKLDTRTGLLCDIRERAPGVPEKLEGHEQLVPLVRHPEPARRLRYDAAKKEAVPVVEPEDRVAAVVRELPREVLGAVILLLDDPKDARAREVVKRAAARIRAARDQA